MATGQRKEKGEDGMEKERWASDGAEGEREVRLGGGSRDAMGAMVQVLASGP